VTAGGAEIAANVLVAADLRGVDTHGVIRFNPQAWYVKWLTEGSMTARPNIRIICESSSTALIDGDRGMGTVIGHKAMEMAIRKAKESGIGMIPRGEVGLIFAGIGASLAIEARPLLAQNVYSAIVLMVLITTLITPIGLRWVFGK
jgi:L-2-hydroxycarboxylate dehydrogenase (NAD+)